MTDIEARSDESIKANPAQLKQTHVSQDRIDKILKSANSLLANDKVKEFFHEVADLAKEKTTQDKSLSFFSLKGIKAILNLIPTIIANYKSIRTLYDAYKDDVFSNPKVKSHLLQNPDLAASLNPLKEDLKSIAEGLKGIDKKLVGAVIDTLSTEDGRNKLGNIYQRINQKNPDYIPIARDFLQFLEDSPGLKDAVLESKWLRGIVEENALKKAGMKEPLVGQITSVMRNRGAFEQLIEIAKAATEKTPNYVNVAHSALAFLDAHPNLKGAVLESKWLQEVIENALKDAGMEKPLVGQITSVMKSNKDFAQLIEIAKAATAEKPGYVNVARSALAFLDDHPKLKDAVLESAQLRIFIKKVLNGTGMESALVDEITSVMGNRAAFEQLIEIAKAATAETPDYAAVARSTLAFLDAHPELKGAVLGSKWLRDIVKNALTGSGMEEALVGQITSVIENKEDFAQLMEIAKAATAETPDYAAVARSTLAFLDAHPELKGGIITSLQEGWVGKTIEDAIKQRLGSMGADEAFIKQTLGIVQALLEHSQEIEQVLAKRMKSPTTEKADFIRDGATLLLQTGRLSAELQGFFDQQKATLATIAANALVVGDPLSVAPLATAFNTDVDQAALLNTFVAELVNKLGADKKDALIAYVQKNPSSIACMLSRTARGLDNEKFALDHDLMSQNKDYLKLNEEFRAISGQEGNLVNVMKEVVSATPDLKQKGQGFGENFARKAHVLSTDFLTPILARTDKLDMIVDFAVELAKASGAAAKVSKAQEAVYGLRGFVEAVGMQGTFRAHREDVIRVVGQFNPLGRRGAGTAVDFLAADGVRARVAVGAVSKIASAVTTTMAAASAAVTAGKTVLASGAAAPAAAANTEIKEKVAPLPQFSSATIELAGTIGDKIANGLFGDGKDARRKEDREAIIEHIRTVIEQYKVNHIGIGDEELKKIFDTIHVIGSLTDGYRNATKYTWTGLVSGGIFMPKENLTGDLTKKLCGAVERALVQVEKGLVRDRGTGGRAI